MVNWVQRYAAKTCSLLPILSGISKNTTDITVNQAEKSAVKIGIGFVFMQNLCYLHTEKCANFSFDCESRLKSAHLYVYITSIREVFNGAQGKRNKA